VNKMDLVGWDEDVFDSIVTDVGAILESVDARVPLRPVPISASNGDNVVDRSVNMPWYDGPTVLDLLETVDIAPQAGSAAVLPVQWVNRAHGGSDYRGYAGPLHGGVIRIGDAVTVLPKGTRSVVAGITVAGSPADVAVAGDAVAVELADQVDVGRGDVIVGVGDPAPRATTALEADICWLGETDLRPGDRLLLRHLSSEVTATVTDIRSRLDLDSLSSRPAAALALNDIARITLSLDRPVVATTYEEGRATGSVVAVDPASNATVGALMVRKVENA